jgi:hypothetical protein
VRPLAWSLLLAGGLSWAAPPAPTGTPGGERFVELATGLGLTSDSNLRLRRTTADGPTDLKFIGVSWEDHSLEGPSARYTAVRVGYFTRRHPWLGVAADFVHYKVFARVGRTLRVAGTSEGLPVDAVQPMSDLVQRYVVGNGVNLLPLSLLARARAGSRVEPYLSLGVGPTLLYTGSVVQGDARSGPYEFGRPAYCAGAGVRLGAGRRLGALLEYRHSRTTVDGSVNAGDSRARLRTNHYVVGGTLRF